MSEADKLFEELGYEKTEGNDYTTYTFKNNDKTEKWVICFRDYHFYVEYLYECKPCAKKFDLSMQELKAINKKVEELGWSDE